MTNFDQLFTANVLMISTQHDLPRITSLCCIDTMNSELVGNVIQSLNSLCIGTVIVCHFAGSVPRGSRADLDLTYLGFDLTQFLWRGKQKCPSPF